eukprot:362548-Chlamydomonas_euryale.AAC.5
MQGQTVFTQGRAKGRKAFARNGACHEGIMFCLLVSCGETSHESHCKCRVNPAVMQTSERLGAAGEFGLQVGNTETCFDNLSLSS